jgi:PPOX class probable F420-dependent enzyme
MAATLPSGVKKLFQGQNFAHLATLMRDGSPQVTPVWVDLTGGDLILVNTAEGRTKPRNVRRDARVAISIIGADNAYANATVRGRVVKITHEGADESIDRLAKKYLGADKYPFRQPGEQRVILIIEPEHVTASGTE